MSSREGRRTTPTRRIESGIVLGVGMVLSHEALGGYGAASNRTIGGRTQYFRFISRQNAIWAGAVHAVKHLVLIRTKRRDAPQERIIHASEPEPVSRTTLPCDHIGYTHIGP